MFDLLIDISEFYDNGHRVDKIGLEEIKKLKNRLPQTAAIHLFWDSTNSPLYNTISELLEEHKTLFGNVYWQQSNEESIFKSLSKLPLNCIWVSSQHLADMPVEIRASVVSTIHLRRHHFIENAAEVLAKVREYREQNYKIAVVTDIDHTIFDETFAYWKLANKQDGNFKPPLHPKIIELIKAINPDKLTGLTARPKPTPEEEKQFETHCSSLTNIARTTAEKGVPLDVAKIFHAITPKDFAANKPENLDANTLEDLLPKSDPNFEKLENQIPDKGITLVAQTSNFSLENNPPTYLLMIDDDYQQLRRVVNVQKELEKSNILARVVWVQRRTVIDSNNLFKLYQYIIQNITPLAAVCTVERTICNLHATTKFPDATLNIPPSLSSSSSSSVSSSSAMAALIVAATTTAAIESVPAVSASASSSYPSSPSSPDTSSSPASLVAATESPLVALSAIAASRKRLRPKETPDPTKIETPDLRPAKSCRPA